MLPWRTLMNISQTTKAFKFKFDRLQKKIFKRTYKKFQGHMTSTDDVIAFFYRAPPLKKQFSGIY